MSDEVVNAILHDYISSEELSAITNKYNAALHSGEVSTSIRFQYALALVRSRYIGDNLRSIQLLEDLTYTGEPNAFRDYLYYLTIANIKTQNFERAKKCVEKFLTVEPNNRQANDLKAYIDSKVFNNGLKGMAIVGGVAVVLSAVAAFAFSKK